MAWVCPICEEAEIAVGYSKYRCTVCGYTTATADDLGAT